VRLLHFWTGCSKNDAQTVWVNTSCGKEHSQKNNQTRYCGIATYITKSLQTSEKTDNLVHKLTTDKLQPVLINVLIRAIFVHLGFTATRLRCGGIFSNLSVRQSLLSLLVKE